jgi:hypothetical protein
MHKKYWTEAERAGLKAQGKVLSFLRLNDVAVQVARVFLIAAIGVYVQEARKKKCDERQLLFPFLLTHQRILPCTPNSLN